VTPIQKERMISPSNMVVFLFPSLGDQKHRSVDIVINESSITVILFRLFLILMGRGMIEGGI